MSSIRRLPLPSCEPPYDDELQMFGPPGLAGDASRTDNPETAGVQGMLALSFLLPSGVTAVPQPPPELRLVPTDDSDETDADADDFGPLPTGRDRLPAPRPWAARLLQAVVEVMCGLRPVGQLVRWTTSDVYDEIAQYVRSPVWSSDGTSPCRGIVRSLHVTEPADGVAEVCALVSRGPRCSAVALRLEGLDGRWQCTALRLG
ncbi:MAG: hypothetical protein H0T17_03885 [Propionibacteriales bacterium]|nr:hypothetical protein [Propionibacteriales bacterium]